MALSRSRSGSPQRMGSLGDGETAFSPPWRASLPGAVTEGCLACTDARSPATASPAETARNSRRDRGLEESTTEGYTIFAKDDKTQCQRRSYETPLRGK